MYNLEIKLLGGFAAASPTGPLSFRSDKVRGLLAYLVTKPNQPLSRDTLAGLFFPDQDRKHGRKNLNLLLTRLRQALAPTQALQPDTPLLLTSQDTVELVWSDAYHWADAPQVEIWQNECEHHTHTQLENCSECLYRLGRIVALYQGDFLAGFGLDATPAFDEWRLWQQEHFLEMTLMALLTLAEQALATNQPVEAEQFARRHIQLSRWQEQPHRQVMQALAQQGKIAAALNHFVVCQNILAAELGASPSPETWAYYHQLLKRSLPTPEKTTLKPLPSPQSPLNQRVNPVPLPQPGTPFFGRTAQIEELSQIVLAPTQRLITLVGAGGMGKTRLATALAHRLQTQFTQGASFVPLAPLAETNETMMAQAIAAAMGYVFPGATDPVTELLTHVQPQHHLMVLDNFEHLLDQTSIVRALLEIAPQLTILATSRHPLGLPDEQVYPLKGLKLPRHEGDAAADSVQLFAERASRTGIPFRLNEVTLPTVTHICRFLQGWPLALELAASWMTEFSLTEIETNLIQHLERLQTPYRDVVDRHKSMGSVLSWSYALLTPQAQQLLARLAVFQGGWTEEAALAVVGATPALLQHLQQHVFIERQPDGRFTIHELIRQFAQAHLNTWDDCVEAHSHYYLNWLKDQKPALYGPEPMVVLPQIGADLNNIRKAWHGAAKKGRLTLLNDVLAALSRYYLIKGLAATAVLDMGAAAEHIESYALAQHTAGDPTGFVLTGRLWVQQALAYARLGALEEADAAADRAWAFGDPVTDHLTLSKVMYVRGIILHMRGHTHDARNALLTAVSLARKTDCPGLVVNCLRFLVRPLVTTNSYLAEALVLAHQLNDGWLKNEVSQSAAGVAFYEGRLWQSYEYWRESLAYSYPFANRLTTARLENNLGDLARRFGDYTQAFIYQNSARQTFQEMNDAVMEAHVLEGLTRLYWQTGQIEMAWQLSQQAEEICRQRNMTACLGYLACTRGRILSANGDIRQAKAAYREAIACSSACNHPQLAMEAYAGLAEISCQQGDGPTALMWCETILNFLAEGHVLEGFTETAWIYLTCVRVLDMLGNKRARVILERAQSEIYTLAAQITNETIRLHFLHISANRAVLMYKLAKDETIPRQEPSGQRRFPEIAALIRNQATNQAAT